MPKIIDAHSHYMPPDVAAHTAFFKVAWSDVNRQLSIMDECGISKALLLYPTSDAHLNMGGWQNVCSAYNPAIAGVIREHKDRFIGAGILPSDNAAQFKDELKRIQDLGLKVLSLASSYDGIYLEDEKFHVVYDFAREHNMLIHVHPQILNPIGEDRVRDPLLTPVLEYVFDVSMCIGKMMMAGTFLKFPEVKFIFAHYGGVLPFVKERFDNTYLMLRKRQFVKDLSQLPGDYFKNLYFDVSGTKSKAALQCALEVTDASHILFGSDYPANQNVPQSIATINDAPLSDEMKAAIMENRILSKL
jgi:predicted TIM-barrel fold metal-dependent hydrolase